MFLYPCVAKLSLTFSEGTWCNNLRCVVTVGENIICYTKKMSLQWTAQASSLTQKERLVGVLSIPPQVTLGFSYARYSFSVVLHDRKRCVEFLCTLEPCMWWAETK